jgi:hypothetical protein
MFDFSAINPWMHKTLSNHLLFPFTLASPRSCATMNAMENWELERDEARSLLKYAQQLLRASRSRVKASRRSLEEAHAALQKSRQLLLKRSSDKS